MSTEIGPAQSNRVIFLAAVRIIDEAERQALAMMEHPNIARVLDAGTTAKPPSLPSDHLQPLRQTGSILNRYRQMT